MSPDCHLSVAQLPLNADATSNPEIRAGDSLRTAAAYQNRIVTTVPEYDMHNASIVFAKQMLADPRQQSRPERSHLGWWT